MQSEFFCVVEKIKFAFCVSKGMVRICHLMIRYACIYVCIFEPWYHCDVVNFFQRKCVLYRDAVCFFTQAPPIAVVLQLLSTLKNAALVSHITKALLVIQDVHDYK